MTVVPVTPTPNDGDEAPPLRPAIVGEAANGRSGGKRGGWKRPDQQARCALWGLGFNRAEAAALVRAGYGVVGYAPVVWTDYTVVPL